MRLLVRPLDEARGEHRGECQGDDGRNHDGTVSVMANSRNSRPTIPHEQNGDQDGNQRQADRHDGEAISPAPLRAASSGAMPSSMCRVMFFQHHDRVIHDEADGDDERHERQVIEAVAHDPHGRERADQGNRQRQNRNDRRANVAQEQKITATTRPMVSISVNCTSSTELLIVVVRSVTSSSLIDFGSVA